MNLTAGKQLYAALKIDIGVAPLDRLDKYIAIEYFLTLEDDLPEEGVIKSEMRTIKEDRMY
ncbi:MAG: hypothetical protein WCQ26_12750, partial [Pseudanabaena sp. ELA748]